MLFQYPSQYQIDSMYTGYFDSLDISILFFDPNSICYNESLLYICGWRIKERKREIREKGSKERGEEIHGVKRKEKNRGATDRE